MPIGSRRTCHSTIEHLREVILKLQTALLRPIKVIRLLRRLMTNVTKRRRRRRVWEKLEAERLDRIRNPANYRGR